MTTGKKEGFVCKSFFVALFSLVIVTMFRSFEFIDIMFLVVIAFYLIKYCYLIIKG